MLTEQIPGRAARNPGTTLEPRVTGIPQGNHASGMHIVGAPRCTRVCTKPPALMTDADTHMYEGTSDPWGTDPSPREGACTGRLPTVSSASRSPRAGEQVSAGLGAPRGGHDSLT